MERPLVSTITPCFRMKKYLRTFLEWLPRQTLFDRIEVVLDHNEPDDEEMKWVREFQARYPNRLKHIVIEKVDPIGTSMNRCIHQAQADLLCIWNVDDLRPPNSLESQANALASRAHDIASGNYIVVNKFVEIEGRLVRHDHIPEEELTRSMILGPFFMFRKSLLTKAGFFDEQLRSGADFDLAIRLAMHGQTVCVPNPVGYYLDEGVGASTHPNSLQPVERTVIELRYGIYDKIDYRLVARACQYDIPFMHLDGQRLPIRDFVPDYPAFLLDRFQRWHDLGIRNFLRHMRAEQNPVVRSLRKARQRLAKMRSI